MSNQSASRLLNLREASENYWNHTDLRPLSTQPKITKIKKYYFFLRKILFLELVQKVGSKTFSDLRAVYDYVWPLNHTKPRASPMHSLISPISPIQNVYVFPIFQCALTFLILGVRQNPWNLKLLSVLSRGSEIYSLIGAVRWDPWGTLYFAFDGRYQRVPR